VWKLEQVFTEIKAYDEDSRKKLIAGIVAIYWWRTVENTSAASRITTGMDTRIDIQTSI
jgi:predicted RNase H-like nuclease